jgi:hypothetical protein
VAADAAMWRKDWTIKPNGEAFVKLMTEGWVTKGEADVVNGKLKFRRFYGEYEVEAGGKK